MYQNLRLEMMKRNVTVTDIAKELGKRRATIGDKINGKYRIYIDEAFAIKKKFFPESTIEYLFEDSEDIKETSGEVSYYET